MMKITALVVDDLASKRDRVVRVVRESLGTEVVECLSAGSGSEAARVLEEKLVDLLIIDLNLPIRTDEPPRRDGGVRLLRQVLRGGRRLKRPAHIIGLTAFEDLQSGWNAEFGKEAWSLVLYSDSSDAWEEVLANRVEHIAERRKAQEDATSTDLAIITALPEPELAAVLDLDAGWREERHVTDDTVYWRGEFKRGERRLDVVAAAAMEMGMAASACLSMKMISRYRPRVVAMAGIAAGVGARVGDVLVADASWDYGCGKIKTSKAGMPSFSPAPSYIPIDPSLKEKMKYFAAHRKEALAGIQARWKGCDVPNQIRLRIGPMATGAAVLEDWSAVESIQALNRKLIGVEMEIFGVYMACRVATVPKPIVFSAKAVSDYGKPPKRDEYQKYAAYVSAAFVQEFALDQLV